MRLEGAGDSCEQHLHGSGFCCTTKSGGSLLQRHPLRNHVCYIDRAQPEQFYRRFEAPTARANQADLIDDDRRAVHRDEAMYRGFHDDRAARADHADRILETFARAGGFYDPIVFRGRQTIPRHFRYDAGARGDAQFFLVMTKLMYAITVGLEYL